MHHSWLVMGEGVDRAREWTRALLTVFTKRPFRPPVESKTVRIFAYSSTREQSNKRSRTRLFEARELRALKTHKPRFTDFFTDFEKKKKTDCFAV